MSEFQYTKERLPRLYTYIYYTTTRCTIHTPDKTQPRARVCIGTQRTFWEGEEFSLLKRYITRDHTGLRSPQPPEISIFNLTAPATRICRVLQHSATQVAHVCVYMCIYIYMRNAYTGEDIGFGRGLARTFYLIIRVLSRVRTCEEEIDFTEFQGRVDFAGHRRRALARFSRLT